MCFLCGEKVENGKDKRKVLAGEEFDQKLQVVVRDRGNDEWAVVVQGRLDAVADLFSADAVYHHTCYVRFTRQLPHPHTPHKVKRGRPPKVEAMYAFEHLCQKLESECENELYTLRELYAIMCDMVAGVDENCENIYTVEYLKELLERRYNEHIYFASRPGRMMLWASPISVTLFCITSFLQTKMKEKDQKLKELYKRLLV